MSRIKDSQDVQPKHRISELLHGASILGLIVVGYFAAALLGYSFSFRPAGVAVVWVPAGFLLATLILLKKADWPFALAGGFIGNALADMAQGISFANALAGATANGLESFAAAWLVVRLLGTPVTLTSLKEVLGLILGAAVLSNAVTALVGSQVLMRSAQMGVAEGWFVWWVGDGMGMLLVAPVVLTLVAQPRPWRRQSFGRVIEGGLLFGALILVANQALGGGSQVLGFLDTNPYMTFPFLFWAALRFGPAGAAVSTLVLAVLTAWNAALGLGPFAAAGASHFEQVLEAYTFLSLAVLSSLVPAAVLSERRVAENRLWESEQRHRLVTETATDAIVTINQDSEILFANPAVGRVFGYAPQELLGREITMLMPDYLRNLHKASVKRYLETGERHINWQGASLTGLRRNGEEFPVEVSFGELVRGGQRLFTGIIRDVTEKRRAEEALRLSEDRYRRLS